MSHISNSYNSVLADLQSLAEIETENKRLRHLASNILLEIAELKERQMIVAVAPSVMHRATA